MLTTRTTRTHAPMDADRKATLASGLFYIGTFLFSIPALGLYGGAIDDPSGSSVSEVMAASCGEACSRS